MATPSIFYILCEEVKAEMFQKTVKGIALSLIGCLALGIPCATAIDISVTPPRWELEINNKQTRSKTIKILNLSNEPVELKAYVRNWTMGEDNQLKETPSSEQSLDQWVVFTPSRVTIPPRGTQTVRFEIRPKVKPIAGEHRAVIFLEEINPDESAIAIGRVGVVIYGNAGEIKRIGSLHSLTVDTKPNNLKAMFDISSTGNAYVRLKGQYTIWRATNYPGAKATQYIPNLGGAKIKLPNGVVHGANLELAPVLAGHRRQISLPITTKLPPGNYILDINGDLSGVAVDQGISFTVK
jgi:P pilus assembly chaperone PapD